MKKILSALLILVMMASSLLMVSAEQTERLPEGQLAQVEIAPMNATTLSGHVERINARYIQGWAFNTAPGANTMRVRVHIYVYTIYGRRITREIVTANQFRSDLRNSQRDGYQFFRWQWNGGVTTWQSGSGVRRGMLAVRVYFVEPGNPSNTRRMVSTSWRSPYIHPQYSPSPGGIPNANVQYHIDAATVDWENAIRRGAGLWNTAAGAGVNATETAAERTNNRVAAFNYDWDAYGRYWHYNPHQSIVGRADRFTININTRTIARRATNGNQFTAANTDFATAVVVHEFGHAFWLSDEPLLATVTTGTSRSIMLRDSIFNHNIHTPQAVDRDAVRTAFQHQSLLLFP